MYKYFKDSEIKDLNGGLVMMLDQARGLAGIPFVITSGYRTAEHSIEVGGYADDPHTKGLAVDLRCRNSRERFLILKALFDVGFVRIGEEVDHIHCDIDTLKDTNVVFLK